MEPEELTRERLQHMTDGFSEKRKLGHGEYGTVYKGVDENGQEVAVKLLHNIRPGIQDEEFKNEFENLKKLNHPHIMKLIGYCYQTQHTYMEFNGKTIAADRIYRALCLEYLHNGSLQNFLSEGICDGQLDWHTRFTIIKGACEGLKYLHEELKEPIYHLDLKPANILLDHNMVPKLADFGLSKIFGEGQTKVTNSRIGTMGYMPPEYLQKGVISKMFDIYSLGVVMIKTIAGLSGYSISDEMPAQEFINFVHDTWREKLQEKWRGSLLEAYCQQVRRCTEIALKCVEVDRKNRPNIVDIVSELKDLATAADEISRCRWGKLLSVHPFLLEFPSEDSRLSRYSLQKSYPLHLTNNTDDNIQYRLLIPRQELIPQEYNPYWDIWPRSLRFLGQLSGYVPPRTTHTCFLTIHKRLDAPAKGHEFFTLEHWRCGRKNEVHQLEPVALYKPPGAEKTTSTSKVLLKKNHVSDMDVHPTESWIMLARFQIISIYDYEMRTIREVWVKNGPSSILQCCLGGDSGDACVTVVKFIARKKWFVAGVTCGDIHVYSYDDQENKKVRQLRRAHSEPVVSLAIHPAEPFVLSSSQDGYIKLWDFEKDWKVMRVFGHSDPRPYYFVHDEYVVFNPRDSSIFASIGDGRIKIWSRHLPECTYTSVHTGEKTSYYASSSMFKSNLLRYHFLNYFSRGDELFLIGCFPGGIAKIWDFQSMECVETLYAPCGSIRAACSHPHLPVLITGSVDGTVCLWNSTTFKLERTLNFGLGEVVALECLKDSRRIAIIHEEGLALTDIGSDHAGPSTEEAVEQEHEKPIRVDT